MFDEVNLSKEDPKFIVYIHVSPNNKRYVGITSQSTKARWGVGGKGYIENHHFYSAIQRYGWDNFKHVIVASNLDILSASEMECRLIQKYNTMDPAYGYNHTTGGNWSSPSDEVREKLRKATSTRWKNGEYRERMCMIQKSIPHKPLTEQHKHNISLSTKGRPSKMKGKHLSEQHRAKLRGRVPWNKGLTKETDKRLSSVSDKLTDRSFDAATCNKMRMSRLDLYRQGYCPRWFNNGCVEIQIDVSNCTSIPEGFEEGRLPSVYVTDGDLTKKVHPDKVRLYLDQGWRLGKSKHLDSKIKKSAQKYIWRYKNKEFSSATELAEHLRMNGYPKIVGSTITSLFIRGFESSVVYSSLSGEITREEVTHEDN